MQHSVLHSDESTLQVLKEPGKSAQSKSYMWLYRTSGDTEHPMVLLSISRIERPKIQSDFWKVSPDICTRTGTRVTTRCLKTSQWWVALRVIKLFYINKRSLYSRKKHVILY